MTIMRGLRDLHHRLGLREGMKMVDRFSNRNYRIAIFWLFIMILGMIIFLIPYIFLFWNITAIILIDVGSITLSIGLILFAYYMYKYFQDLSRKEVEKVEEFVHEWEMRRYGGRKI